MLGDPIASVKYDWTTATSLTKIGPIAGGVRYALSTNTSTFEVFFDIRYQDLQPRKRRIIESNTGAQTKVRQFNIKATIRSYDATSASWSEAVINLTVRYEADFHAVTESSLKDNLASALKLPLTSAIWLKLMAQEQ